MCVCICYYSDIGAQAPIWRLRGVSNYVTGLVTLLTTEVTYVRPVRETISRVETAQLQVVFKFHESPSGGQIHS